MYKAEIQAIKLFLLRTYRVLVLPLVYPSQDPGSHRELTLRRRRLAAGGQRGKRHLSIIRANLNAN